MSSLFNEITCRKSEKMAEEVFALEPEIHALSDEELKAKTIEFKKVLEDCGVFKWNEHGRIAMEKYTNNLKQFIEN